MAQQDFIPVSVRRVREAELMLRVKAGDNSAVHELALSARAWSQTQVNAFLGQGVERDDLLSEAYLGLVKAVSGFDPSKGLFASYATRFITSALWDLVRTQGRAVSIPEDAFAAEMARKRRGLSARHDRNGATAEAASAWLFPKALDAPLDLDANATLGDVLVSNTRPFEQAVVETLFLDGLLGTLSETERQVLVNRFELPGATSAPDQSSIALFLGIGRSRVSQIEKQAIAKLRESSSVSS